MRGSVEASVQLPQHSNWGAHDSVGLLVLASILGAIAIHYFFVRKPSGLPPGPRPWPIVGNLPLLDHMPHQSLAHLAQKFGPLMYLRLGTTHTVVASSPDMAREFLRTHDQVFINRPDALVSNIISPDTKMVMANGAEWKHLRKQCLLELFTQKRLDSFQPGRTEEITTAIKIILQESQEGKVVDLNFTLWSLSANNMTRMLMNKRYFTKDVQSQQEAQSFKSIIEQLLRWSGKFIIGDLNRSLRWVSKLQGVDASIRNLSGQVDIFFKRVIDEHREAATGRTGSKTGSTADFVDVLLSMPSEDGKGHLSDETIRIVILNLMQAGSDTSSVTTEWAMTELLRHPDAMKRVQDELDAVVGTSRLVQESDLPHLKYLNVVVKETFRLHPPAPLLLPHESSEACQVAGYNLPPRTRLVVNVWAMGRDPSIWERPLEFEPERFVEHSEIDVKGQHFQLIPFGTGRRGCLGQSLGLLMVHLVLARLLQSFNWSLPKGQDPNTLDMSEHFGITLGRVQPLEAVAEPRLPAHLYD